jgi:hypothetical protein
MSNVVKPAVDGNDLLIDFVIGMAIPDLPQAHVSTDLPATDLVGNLPFVLVHHWSGDTDLFTSNPILDLSVFGASYRKARDMARLIEDRLLGYPFRVSTGGRSVLVDKVEATSPTVEIPWQDDSTVRRFQGTYQISSRR